MAIPLRFSLGERGWVGVVVGVVQLVAGLGFIAWHRLVRPVDLGLPVVPAEALGGFLVLMGVVTLARQRRRVVRQEADARALEEHRDAPWRVRPEWRRDEIPAEGSLDRSFLALAVVWNLLTWPLAFLLLRGGGDSGEGAVWLLALFPLIGLAMLARVGYQLLRWRRFGRPVVRLDPMPLRLGGVARGIVQARVPRSAMPGDGFLVGLSCYRQRVRVSRDSDGDRQTRVERDLLWRDEARLQGDPRMDGTGVEVPFAFELPVDGTPSTPLKLKDRILWEVSAEAEMPGIDFVARFEVPVFASEEPEPAGGPQGRAASPAASGAVRQPRPAASLAAPRTRGIVLVEEPHLFELHFTAARNRRNALILGGIGGLFVVGGFPLVAASGLMGLLFIAVGGLAVYGSIQQATNDTVLRISGGRIEVTHDGIGMPQDIDVDVDLVDEVLAHLESGSSSQATYAISLVTRPGAGLEHLQEQAATVMGVIAKFGVEEDHPIMEAMQEGAERPRVSVASGLNDKEEADWLASRILDAVERERQTPDRESGR